MRHGKVSKARVASLTAGGAHLDAIREGQRTHMHIAANGHRHMHLATKRRARALGIEWRGGKHSNTNTNTNTNNADTCNDGRACRGDQLFRVERHRGLRRRIGDEPDARDLEPQLQVLHHGT